MKKTINATKQILTFCLLLILAGHANAQTNTDQMVKDWQRAKAYTAEYLDAMPESGYAFKPSQEMRSFAEQMLHLAETNYSFAAAASGQKSPYDMGQLEKSGIQSKSEVTKAVLAGYDFVLTSIKKLDQKQFNESIKLFGRFDLKREEVFNKSFEHQTHQRGQTTVYLRLQGVKAPSEKLF